MLISNNRGVGVNPTPNLRGGLNVPEKRGNNMEKLEKSVILEKETGALRGARFDFYTVKNERGAIQNEIRIKITNDNYSVYTAPINFIIDCLLIPGLKGKG